MASYKKINNKWSVVFDMPSPDGKRCQKRLSGYITKREAEIAYIDFKGEGTVVKPKGRYPFDEVYKNYKNFQMNRIKESSIISISYCFEKHINPTFKNYDVTEITTTDIIDWQTGLNLKNLSYNYKKKTLDYFKTFFNYCVHIIEIIKESPIKRQIKFVNKGVKPEMLIYSPEEYTKFRSAIKREIDRIIFDMLYFTGMRKGELLALKWSDFNGHTISITKTYTRKTLDGNWNITAPKTRNSVRDIKLAPFLAAELTAFKDKNNFPDDYYILGDEAPNNERYISNARDRYIKIAKTKHIRIHDFRHSHISYLISCNIDLMSIAKRAGDNVETILKTYAHLLQRHQEDVLNRLEEISSNFA